jgi:8-oxo-dGTP pyrophosphatase MutT (NUDIX family)
MRKRGVMQNNVILKSLLHPMLGVCLLLVGMMIVPQLAQANAGMVIAAEQDGKIYVLFVQSHKHDDYEFPGGRQERAEDLLHGGHDLESLYETAVRETVEETRAYLGRQQLVSSSSNEQMIELGKHTLFLAKLPFFELNAVKAIKIPKGKKWSPMREVVNYAWVDINLINQAGLVETRDAKMIKLNPVAVDIIKLARLSRWFN